MNLTDDDYDALYFAIKLDMPQIRRDIFPKILEQWVKAGDLEITVTDEEIVVRTSLVPGGAEYCVERKRRLVSNWFDTSTAHQFTGKSLSDREGASDLGRALRQFRLGPFPPITGFGHSPAARSSA